MAFTENPAVFLPEFGKDVVLTPSGGGAAKNSRGIYEAPFSEGAGMGSTSRSIQVPSIDVPANITRGTANITGVGVFTVSHPETDGTGWTTLMLEG